VIQASFRWTVDVGVEPIVERTMSER
jgi:hypothetical protein